MQIPIPNKLFDRLKTFSEEMALRRISSGASRAHNRNSDLDLEVAAGVAPKRGMVLPFTPLAMSFNDVNYYVDMPVVSHNSLSTFISLDFKRKNVLVMWDCANFVGNERARSDGRPAPVA